MNELCYDPLLFRGLLSASPSIPLPDFLLSVFVFLTVPPNLEPAGPEPG